MSTDSPIPSTSPDASALVLVVDDVADNRDLLGRRVRKMGHEVSFAADGAEALAQLRQRSFDLVLLDIMMPGMDGYAVLEAMRSDPSLRPIPVIVISAQNELDSVIRCIALGAEDHLPKPFNAVLLQARVGAALERKRLRDQERRTMEALAQEQVRSQRLLESLFPRDVAELLKRRPAEEGFECQAPIAQSFANATVLFADIQDFSRLTAGKPADAIVSALNRVFSLFDHLAELFRVEKVKTISDAYMAVAGVPTPRFDHAEAAADLALAMQSEMTRLDAGLGEALSLRIGMSSGPVTAGVVGTRRVAYDVWGEPVVLASQMESFGVPGGIQVTASTYKALVDTFVLEERGEFYIRGKGEVSTYLLKGRRY